MSSWRCWRRASKGITTTTTDLGCLWPSGRERLWKGWSVINGVIEILISGVAVRWNIYRCTEPSGSGIMAVSPWWKSTISMAIKRTIASRICGKWTEVRIIWTCCMIGSRIRIQGWQAFRLMVTDIKQGYMARSFIFRIPSRRSSMRQCAARDTDKGKKVKKDSL